MRRVLLTLCCACASPDEGGPHGSDGFDDVDRDWTHDPVLPDLPCDALDADLAPVPIAPGDTGP